MSEKGIEYMLNQTLVRSGARRIKEVHMSHGFRKFFITTCESSPMKSLHVSMLAGHDTGIKQRYNKPDESVLLEDYMNAVDALTINPNQRLQTKIKKLEIEQSDELRQVKSQLQELKDYTEEISENWILFAKPEWDILKKRLPDLMKLLKEK